MGMRIVKRICNICNKEFETSSNNHGLTYKDNKIFVCQQCIKIKSKCFTCGKEILVRFNNKNKKSFCSKKCHIEDNIKISKINGTGVHNIKHQIEAGKVSNKINKLNGTGIYNSKIRIASHISFMKNRKLEAFLLGYKSYSHMNFQKNKKLIKEFIIFEKYQLFLKKYNINKSKLSKQELLKWSKDQYAIRHGFNSYIELWCNNKKKQLINQFNSLDINKIVSILSDSSTEWDKRQSKAYSCVTELGNIDYFLGKRISKEEITVDENCKASVYGLKLIKKNQIVYIGESMNFDNRYIEHQNKIKLNGYPQISKFITSSMIEGIDWEMIKLVTSPKNILESSIYKIKYWLSLVECQLIHYYGTNKLANNETGTF